jgi:hypothetical protein
MRTPEDPEHNWQVADAKRRRSEEREARAHQVAAALDECLTLLMLALLQAERTPRGMQARRARRLRAKFTNLRLAALDGQSPCSPTRTQLEVLDEAVVHNGDLAK